MRYTWISSSRLSADGKAAVSWAQPVSSVAGRPCAAILSISSATLKRNSSAIRLNLRSNTCHPMRNHVSETHSPKPYAMSMP